MGLRIPSDVAAKYPDRPVLRVAQAFKEEISRRSRAKRAGLLRRVFNLTPDTVMLDLGGGDGRHLRDHFSDLKNVCVADYDDRLLAKATAAGLRARKVDGTERLPFDDQEVELVFCSSVIEHVTGPKNHAVDLFKRDAPAFYALAAESQAKFAAEIRRIGQRYYVQTPAKWFPLETHTCLPLINFLPTHWQWFWIKLFGPIWIVRQTRPDWRLLTYRQMQELFPTPRSIESSDSWDSLSDLSR